MPRRCDGFAGEDALVGDNSLNRIVYQLRDRVSRSYPATLDPKLKVLPMIGVNTGEVGAKWNDIKEGFLMVEEPKLDEVLEKSPESVREYFGSDTNSDGTVDDGLAYTLDNDLKPYTRISGNILKSKIKMLRDLIADNQKRIVSHASKVEKFESKMRIKFQGMEAAIKKSKGEQEYLKNYNPNRK